MTIAELAEDRVVEGIYAVKTKRKLRTKGGASYLALELVDPTGRIEARVWNDVELLDGRFAEGDAVRVLGRVEKFRDRLQLDVRSLEASDVDPSSLTPKLRRDAEELAGFLEFLVAEITHPGLAATVRAVLADRPLADYPATPDDHHSYAGGLLEHTVGVATLCRETSQLHPRLRPDLVLAAALLHDVGRTIELGPGPAFTPTERRPAARSRAPRVATDRRTRGRSTRRSSSRSCSTASPCTTKHAARAPPRRQCCTTRISSTRSPRRAPSIDGASRSLSARRSPGVSPTSPDRSGRAPGGRCA